MSTLASVSSTSAASPETLKSFFKLFHSSAESFGTFGLILSILVSPFLPFFLKIKQLRRVLLIKGALHNVSVCVSERERERERDECLYFSANLDLLRNVLNIELF
jgi:hypothetical protein